jgi:hypothetical protein
MTRAELANGSAIFLIVIVAGFSSAGWVERHYAARPAQVPPTSSACVTEDGSWRNWIWANVPMLSPKCATDR